ncbi:Tat proofreading chaperone DmsD [Brenneria izbisi]|uniref:Tat proofreading chaperone DmsD n=1 Tax=Brenneria izbisi TaxID=2939450 RepID=A0AA41XY61_9GAMM|nr:Tat proofreading chaperone DmsD [Brenneria izbisi]MCV9879613.1 Tat proofreading chaperone DmsD [Brenneria izbisi]MCV9883002.1 Tat proofreading chaperone DmsD [Brenneria izbisi]
MLCVAALPRLLGALFYYPPSSPEIGQLLDNLDQIPELYRWQDKARVQQICQQLHIPEAEAFNWQFSVLFEGQGEMQAPPWGSVYLDKDNLLMGDSTTRYRKFLQHNQLTFIRRQHEPEDQFGLMLLALACLLERKQEDAVVMLLEEHLLPWSHRYLHLLRANTQSAFYAQLAQITEQFLQEIQHSHALSPRNDRIYR